MRRSGLVLLLLAASALPAASQESSCIACHGNADLFGEEHARIIADTASGAHAAAELSCHDCHGGNPDPTLAEDMTAAMDPEYEQNPYRGAPSRAEVPSFCGRCHSDPTYMRRFVPDPRVDQQEEYWTSQHGMLLRQDDPKVATCISCHGVHGILGPGNTSSPVHPTQVAETCRGCHGDPEYMAGYRLADGDPLPVDQYARWRQSVHARGLLEGGDLSAPTCNDCHGNHGAVPPGVESIGFVCGQCHGREAGLFRASAKRTGYADHAEFLADAGEEACATCHAADQPQAGLPVDVHFTECTTCHGNHGIVSPTTTMLSPLPETPCVYCHQELADDLPDAGAGQDIRRHFAEVRDELMRQADEEGLSGEDRFNWLVQQARRLPFHTEGEAGEGDEPELRPEFRRLFDKFRIGTTFYSYPDPVTGETVRAPLLRCADCHAEEPDLAEEPHGLRTSQEFSSRLRTLTTYTARAERLLLAAHRGGVETRSVADEIDQAVEAQIELTVLVHTFSAASDGEFVATAERGLEHATEAIHLAEEALGELSFRRRGLAASLIVILLVLVALALKIRQLS